MMRVRCPPTACPGRTSAELKQNLLMIPFQPSRPRKRRERRSLWQRVRVISRCEEEPPGKEKAQRQLQIGSRPNFSRNYVEQH